MNRSFQLERFLRRYAIRNLMQYIVIGQGLVYILMYVWPSLGMPLYSELYLSRSLLMHGQIWRLLTFVFIPPVSSPLFVLFSLYFYYLMGSGLENCWGTVRFNLFYTVGMIGAWLTCLLTGYADPVALNLSLFLAYAALNPNESIYLLGILPIKMKYLALVDLLIYLQRFVAGPASARIAIILSLLNIILFLGGDLLHTLRRESQYWKTRYNFRKAMRK